MYFYMTVLVTLVSSPSWQVDEANRESDLRGGLGSFTEAISGTRECTLDGRA
jgi:hypothetical protein